MMVGWKTKDPFASFFGGKFGLFFRGAAFAVSFMDVMKTTKVNQPAPQKKWVGFGTHITHIITLDMFRNSSNFLG